MTNYSTVQKPSEGSNRVTETEKHKLFESALVKEVVSETSENVKTTEQLSEKEKKG